MNETEQTIEALKPMKPNDPYVIGQLVGKTDDERTPAEREALQLHERLTYDRQMLELGIVSMCRDLKEIRDGKHYITLGYSDFGEYTEQCHGIGARQAYKYIRVYEKLGVEILNSSSKIGVTKLLELASLDDDERKELLAEHPIEELGDMSTAEVKRLTEQVKKLEEQISFLENTPVPDENAIRSEVEKKLRSEYDNRISETERNAKSESQSEIANLKAELKQARSEMKMSVEAIKAAEARAKQAEEKAVRANELEKKYKAAEAEKAAMEKQIRLSSDPELARFKFVFEAWQASTSEMFEQLDKLDSETQEKMRAAVKAVMGARL